MKKLKLFFVLLLSIAITSCTIVTSSDFTSSLSSNSISEVTSSQSSFSSDVSTFIPSTSSSTSSTSSSSSTNSNDGLVVSLEGKYNSKNEVAKYINIFHKLPTNYVTKAQAEAMGGIAKSWTFDNKLSIGGDIFNNREQLLPIVKGRTYYECDIDTMSSTRGVKRIVFSSDFEIYYTSNHYASFERLY